MKISELIAYLANQIEHGDIECMTWGQDELLKLKWPIPDKINDRIVLIFDGVSP